MANNRMQQQNRHISRNPLGNTRGHAIITSVIFVSITLIFTLAYLSWSAHQKVAVKHQYAELQAELAARTGISQTVYPGIMMNTPSEDTSFGEIALPAGRFENTEFQRSFIGNARPDIGQNVQNIYVGEAIGKVEYSIDPQLGSDKTITVTRRAGISLKPKTFGDYLYFTNKEEAGGGAFIFNNDDSRRTVNFGSDENWEGPVHSNDALTMSNFGCPTFESDLTTSFESGGINWGDCDEDQILAEGAEFDTINEIIYPLPGVIEDIERDANKVYDATPLSGPVIDTLIMTEIEFIQGGYKITQWKYTIPSSKLDMDIAWGSGLGYDAANDEPVNIPLDSAAALPTEWYHPDEPMGYFHHFDFPRPDPDSLEHSRHFYRTEETVPTNQSVIFVRNGQVLVHGTVDGRFTIATNEKTRYAVRNPIFGSGRDEMYNNIWIIDDIKYLDSLPNGQVQPGSPNRLGLISGANVIVANTPANRNDVIINAGIMAFHESFVAHYWQNTVEIANAYLPPLGDARGPIRVNNGFLTGNADDRGLIHLWGSIVQEYRGYVRRNTPGPYPTGDIGYGKDYHYDFNFSEDSPPPLYPVVKMVQGYTEMDVTDISVGN